jgi:hypothetical protein
MPTAIADLDKPIAGMTTPHAASCLRARLSVQRTERRVRVIYNLEVRERSKDLNALIPGMAALLFIMV